MLELKNACLKRGPQLLFENASFIIYPSKRVGVTGANGAGKSSLFSLILKNLELDTGDFTLSSKLVIAHVEQEIRNQHLSAIDYALEGDKELSDTLRELGAAETAHDAENIARLHHKMEEIQGYAGKSKAAKLLNGLSFTQEQFSNPVSSFSGGWQMRLNLARALMCRSDILLLDEPTNHLDLDAVLWLEDYLKSYAGTLLLISHDRDFLDSVINQVLHISRHQVSIYNGNYSSYENFRTQQIALQQAGYEKQQKHIQHVQSFINRFKAQATKAKQAQSRIKALEKLELIGPAHIDSPFHFSFKAPANNPHTLLRLDDVSVAYGQKPIIENVNLNMFAGDRIGILGANGAGKSTLVKLLSNELIPSTGKIEANNNLNIGYFAQHQLSQLNLQNSALQHMSLLDKRASEQQLRDYLGGFNFHDDKVSQTIETFSGGEKARLVLAMIVYLKPNLLLLDEPTNHLDLDMRDALTLALQDFQGALAIVSHDRHLLRTVCDSFILVHNKAVTEFDGDLEDYRLFIKQASSLSDSSSESNLDSGNTISRKEQRKLDADLRKQQQPLRNRVNTIEKSVDLLNAEKAALETLLSDSSIYEDENKSKLTDALTKQIETNRKLEVLEEEWMELLEKLENT
ncbi:MAG: ATP-binding cassette domain-containing protein [Gammaproteobacteria bacterium]|nr:ATP-binding cassette domain-containing protein [Gammaproteobacteria bacterium]